MDPNYADDETIIGVLTRHIVGLTWVDEVVGKPDTTQVLYASTFVVSIKGAWLLVTAGHVLHQLEQRLAAGRTIVNSRLMDGLRRPEAKQRFAPIPFVLPDCRWYYIDDEDKGLDYGIIPLRLNFAQLLDAGGTVALDETYWQDPPQSLFDADASFLLGFPIEAQELSVSKTGGRVRVDVGLHVPLIPLAPVADPPLALKRQFARHYARVPVTNGPKENTAISSVVGMSGGPLFSFRNADGGCRYWVVGVQSGWVESTRVIAASPLEPLLLALSRKLPD